jgi:uncharacterized protein (DUF1800 family)
VPEVVVLSARFCPVDKRLFPSISAPAASNSAAISSVLMQKGCQKMNKVSSFTTRIAVVAVIAAMLAPATLLRANTDPAAAALTEDQKVLHVLNRLGFGARPGDIAKVKTMGIEKYIDYQLNPASISDTLAESKVRGLDITAMTTSEIFAKYPNPGALLRQLEGGRVAQANAQMPQGQPQEEAEMTAAEQRERRQKINQLYRKYDLKPAGQLLPQIVANRVLRAVYSERQLQEVMVDFWQNHFNVFAGKAAVRWYIPSYERDVLRKNALGNFRDLVVGTAQHPAMLFYLDNFQSVAPITQPATANANQQRLQRMILNGRPLPEQARERLKRQFNLTDSQLDQRLKEMRAAGTAEINPPRQNQRGINENYARELMELHTLGVDGGYSQKDIVEVARAFTGWTIADPRGYRRAAAATIQGTEEQRINRLQRQQGIPDSVESGEFFFNARWHDIGTKTVLGKKINEGGMEDGMRVIDILVSHPSTAKHIARKLAVRFVNDKPSDALVARIAEAFRTSNGDIRTTLKALFSDKEFFARENYRAKIKSPFELAVSSIRALGGETNASPAFVAMLRKLGELPYGYQAPTGYPDTAEDWVNTGALLERLNFAVAVASNRIPGSRVDLKGFAGPTEKQMLDKAIASILNGEVSPATRFNLEKQLKQPLPAVKAGEKDSNGMEVPNLRDGQQGTGARQARLLSPSGDPKVFQVVSLVLGTPEFQRQ